MRNNISRKMQYLKEGVFLIIRSSLVFVCISGVFSTPALAAEDPDELYRKGRFAEAEKAYAGADMDHPKDIRYRYNRGCAAFQNSDYKGALGAFSSVMRRAQEDETRFRAAYNLGNTAYQQDEFSSAVTYYKQALFYDPDNLDAKINLELALRMLQRLDEKKKAEKKLRPERGADTRGPKGSGGRGEQDNLPPEDDAREDLSGELDQVESDEEELSEDSAEKPTSIMNKKKAEDLLDQIREDRARFMHFQIPKDKGRGVKSGKDW